MQLNREKLLVTAEKSSIHPENVSADRGLSMAHSPELRNFRPGLTIPYGKAKDSMLNPLVREDHLAIKRFQKKMKIPSSANVFSN